MKRSGVEAGARHEPLFDPCRGDASVAEAVELGAVEHGPATDVGDGIVTGSVQTPGGAILGFICNPHFHAV